jgi:hypothetical protein
MVTSQLAKFMMKKLETFPTPPDIQVGGLQEVFNHDAFLNGSET